VPRGGCDEPPEWVAMWPTGHLSPYGARVFEFARRFVPRGELAISMAAMAPEKRDACRFPRKQEDGKLVPLERDKEWTA
jgi:hypothetical protein